MEIIKDKNFNICEKSVTILGNFDGVHLGHQKLIEKARELSKGKKIVIFTFSPHPVSVLRQDNYSCLFTNIEKEMIFASENIDYLIEYPFDKEFASLSPEVFCDLIFSKVNTDIVVIGEDFNFGKNKMGNRDYLVKEGKKRNITVCVVDFVTYNGKKISSSIIRDILQEGNIELVNTLLNKEYFIFGKVAEGKKIGRTLGFPTVNILPQKDKLLPKDGVYLTTTYYDNKEMLSITNIGNNPTVNGSEKTVETYIFDFNDEIYNKEIKVIFKSFIRGEIKFNNVEELKNQISKDKEFAIRHN